MAKYDRIIAWPGKTSIRIYGDRSGAFLDCPGVYVGKVTRSEAAQVIKGIRAKLRAMKKPVDILK